MLVLVGGTGLSYSFTSRWVFLFFLCEQTSNEDGDKFYTVALNEDGQCALWMPLVRMVIDLI